MVTTDSAGNLASDGGALLRQFDNLFRQADRNSEGVALAMALQDPDFVAGERFGVRAGWGNFEGEDAFGVNLAAVLADSLISPGRGGVSVGGGIGVGASRGTVGVRIGAKFTW